MKRGSELFVWHKMGWQECLPQNEKRKNGNGTPMGHALGVFYYTMDKIDEPAFVEMRDRDEGPAAEGWSICDDCLYQAGEFRGVVAGAEVFNASDETKVLRLTIEDPTFLVD
jgi:hypothetical protein